MVVFIMALMLAFSIALAVVGIHCNNTAPSGHWAKQDIGALLLNATSEFATRTIAQHNWAKDDVRYVVLTKICGFATRTAPSGFWAKRNLGQVLFNVICGLAIRITGTTTATTAATLVATSGTNWCAKDRQLGRWLVRNERTYRPATGSHRVVMARWARRRRFKPVAKVQTGFCAWSVEASVPSRRVRRLRAGVRGLFLSRLADKRAEEKEENLAVEAALAAEAAKAEGRALARAAAKAEVRSTWLAARAARRAEAGRQGKLGAVIGGEVTLTIQSWQRPASATKVAMGKRLRSRRAGAAGLTKGQSWLRWATRAAMTSAEIALQLEAELRRSARLEAEYGVELVGEDARGFQSHRVAVAKRQRNAQKAARLAAHQQREAARAAEREVRDWVQWQRDAVRMGLASPIVTKRPGMGQGIAAQAVVLPVLAEYLGLGLGVAIIGILAAVAIPALLKLITKSKTNEAAECPELLAQWETTEEAVEAEAKAVRQELNQLLIETELMARFQEGAPTGEEVARWEAECEEDSLRYEAQQRELFEESDLAFRLGEHNACARYEEGPTEVGTLSCGVRIRWAQAINSYDQWHVEEEADVFSMATLASGLGCSLFLGYDWPDLGYQRWELERTLEKWLAQVPAAPDESKHFTGDDELAWSQAMFDQWMHDCQAEEQAAAETAHLALGVGQSSLALILPILAPVLGLDVDPLLVVAMVAMAWLISKVSPSFGGFALTLLAGATGYVGATVTGQEADSLQEEEQQGNQPHTDQEGLMVEENVEVANDQATELLGTTKADLMGSLRTKKRASLYAGLAKAAATSMVKVLLGEGVSLEKTSEAMFEWPGLKPEYRKAAYKAHVDSMQPDGAKACQRELKLKEHYGVSLFEGNGTLEDYKHSLHHIHRTPGSAATIEMYDIIERALKSLAEHGDLRAVTIGELAKAWVTLNLIQTNFASEVIALEPMSESQTYLMLNALSKTSFNTIRVKHMAELEKQIKGKGGDGVTGCPTDIFLLYRNAGVLIADGKYNGFDMGSMAYRVRKFTSASKAAKAQKYISQYFAPNLLGGQVIDFAREYTLGKYTFTLKSVSESVLVVKPVSGKSVFEKETAKELADNIYDGVVFVSRRFMALVLPGHVDEIAAGKLDGKVLIGRAYGFNFLIKGGFVIMPPDFIKCTGKDMIAYGSKDEICPTWSENRLTVIINSGVPKSDKGACTDTQTLINGFDLKDKHVQRIFTQIKDDAVEHLRQRLDDVRKGKIQMAELESDILDVMDMDDDEKASDEVLSQLRDSSRLKEIIGAVGYAAGSGMALPQLIAPTMNQMTNQAMDPGRTRLPFSMNMVNAKGEVEYCKIAYSIYPQVHPGLMMQKIAEATGLKLSKGNLALLNGYKNPMTPEQLKELKEEHLECHGLSYDENRNIYCNPADYKKHVERHGTCLVSLFRNPSTFTSGAWGQLVPMECVPVGCYWVNPTPEAFQWFFANQDGADLDDRMIMVMGELAISCILYHEGKKKQLIAKMLAPFKNRENPKTKAAREFIRLQTKFMLKEDMNVSMDADVKLNSEHISMVQDLTGDASTRVLQDMVSDRPLEIGLYSFKETAKQMQKAKYAFSKDTEVDHGSALANVASTIGSLELMKGTTGTAANVQMLMGAITQGLVDFGDGIDLDRKVRIISTSGYDELSESLTSEEFAELDNLTYRDLTFLIKSEMLSNVIDADTQGQNVPEAAEVMEMIWGVSMYLGIALFSGGKSAVQQGKNGTYVTINMISPDKMKFYFPGWLMKRGIGAFAAPFAGQSHMLQHGESAQGKKVNVRHFAFEETKFETANSWVFDIFEDYMDQVLGLAHDQIMATFNEGEAPAWQALELGLQSFSNEVAKARKACNELNELRRAGIMAVHRMGLEPKRRRVALTAVEQGWLAKWYAALPTEEGKLTFALWTLTQLVAAANEKRNDLAFTDRESFVSTSRRSYGSITVKGLPTHTLYVGNLLDADGEAVTCERGLPQGPWLYVLKALNAMAVTPVTAKVDVFFNFTEEYKELKNWIMGMVNCKPGFALETKPCPEVKALMTTKDKFGVHNLDAEVYDNLHSGVVGKTLAEVLQSGLLTVGENKFIGKLNISKNGSTLINKSYSSWRDGSDDKHQDVKVFIEANNLHDYIVTGIEVVLETKATAKQYAYPSFSLTLKYNGPERPLQEINLSAYTETLKSKDSEEVDYTSGPIGYHTDADFDNYDFDDLEDVVVEDFSYSDVIEAEVESLPESNEGCQVTVYQGRNGQSDGREFQYWAEDKEEAGDYGQVVVSRTIDLTGMLIQKSDDGKVVFREFCRLHKLKTGENFNLLSPGENSNLFFARLKAAGYTGISFLGSEENRYVVTFDGDGLV